MKNPSNPPVPTPSALPVIDPDGSSNCAVLESASTFVKHEAKHLHDMVENMNVPTSLEALSNDLPQMPSVAKQIEHIVTDNFTAASIGAMFGAAITAGMGVG